MTALTPNVEQLIRRGVEIHGPASVDVADDVKADRIAPGVVIHAGCRLRGQTLSIGPGCVIGEEAPATVEDCQLGEKVALKGGYFSGAVFLAGASVGSGAHIRPGTILEEQASAAHTVGLKQTVLMPFVTLGSLINFCDCLMAGGTDRRHHSEVGSSYIHFNYTPNMDKATASLLGDVPRGVMLDQPPIFLGGQGGLVGPVRIEYGTVIAAGTVNRKDVGSPGQLVFGAGPSPRQVPFSTGAYNNIRRLVSLNLAYIGNLYALAAWYRHVRASFMKATPHDTACLEGALTQIRAMIEERIRRLGELAGTLPPSADRARQAGAVEESALQLKFVQDWPALSKKLAAVPEAPHPDRDAFLRELDRVREPRCLETLKHLTPPVRQAGTRWLQSVVDSVTALG